MLELMRFVSMLYELAPPWQQSAASIARVRERRLRTLLTTAKAQSPYYAERYAEIDVTRCRLDELPTTNKAEMMADLGGVFTDRRIRRAELERFVEEPGHLGQLYLGQYGVSHTSGSQGQPALIVQDKSALMRTFAVQFSRGTKLPNRWSPHLERLWKPARLAVITQKPGFYPSGAAFSHLPADVRPFCKLLRLSVFDPIADNVARLNEFQPEFIVGYTSSLEVIAREERAGRLQLRKTGKLRQITNVSEPLPEPSAHALREAFGVPVTNEYAMGECMCLSFGCTDTTGSHLNADLAILEVVDHNNRPVPAGTPGAKVLVTNLYNMVQPFIRYEVDDIVTMSAAPCRCGSLFPLIQSVTGRGKDSFWIDIDGRVQDLPYYLFLAALHHELDMAEHQVLQTGLNTFVLRAAPQPGKTLSVERLRDFVLQSVRAEGLHDVLKFDVEIVPSIERGPSGKAIRAKNFFGPPPNGRA